MNSNIPEAYKTDDLLKNKNQTGLHWKTALYCFSTPISIVFPVVVYFLAGKKTIKNSLFLRLIIIIFPCLYSAKKYLDLFLNVRKSQDRSSYLLYFILNSLFLTLAITSILLIMTIYEWANEDPNIFSMVIPSIMVLPSYLLSISCDLTPSKFFFTDTGIDILLSLLMLLHIPLGVGLLYEGTKYHFYFAITSFVATLAKSLKERCLSSRKCKDSTVKWRVVILIFILVSVAIICGIMIFVCLEVLRSYSTSIKKTLRT